MPFSHPIHTYPNTRLRHPSTNASTSPDRRHRRTPHTHACVARQPATSTPQPTPLLRLDGASGKLGATCAHTDTHTAVASTTVHHTSPYRSAMNMRRKMVSETTKKTQAHASHPTHPRLRKRHNPRVKCRSRISYTYLDTALRRPSTNASTSPDRRHQRTHHTHTRVSICNVNSPALAALTP